MYQVYDLFYQIRVSLSFLERLTCVEQVAAMNCDSCSRKRYLTPADLMPSELLPELKTVSVVAERFNRQEINHTANTVILK